MPLFMDMHEIEGGVAAATIHRQAAHGLVADSIFEVSEHS